MNDQEQYEGVDPIINKETRLLGVICYLPIGGLVPILMKKQDSAFVAFHMKQGFAIFIPVILALLIGSLTLWGILFLAYVGFAVFFGIKAWNGETYTFDSTRPYLEGQKNTKK